VSDTKREVRKGLAGAGIILLAAGWLGLVVAGMGFVFSPQHHFPVLGAALLVIAAVVMLVTMDRWVNAFPGLLVLATLNSLIELKTGHALNDPSIKAPWQQAAVLTLSMAASGFVTLRFRTHKLNAIDRIALFVFGISIFYQAAAPRFQGWAGPVAFGALLLAWGYDRFSHHHDRHSASFPAPEA
jgi:hypothetical protein